MIDCKLISGLAMAEKNKAHSFELNNGYSIPVIGLGTSRIKMEEMNDVIRTAVAIGYRHFDTAQLYPNAASLGEALYKVIEDGNVKREEIIVTSKLAVYANRSDDVKESLMECLETLKLSYLDLFLIHSPCCVKREWRLAEGRLDSKEYQKYHERTDHLGIWNEMEKLVDNGLVKSIGVSNFNKEQLSNIIQNSRIKPAVVQIECHAYLQEKDMVDFCRDNDILVSAYAPFGSPGLPNTWFGGGGLPDIFEEDIIKRAASKHSKSPAQILLRFLVQKGLCVIPKSSNSSRLTENINIFDFSLSIREMEEIVKLDRGRRIFHYEFLKEHPQYPWYPFPKN